MPIDEIHIQHCRILSDVSLDPVRGFNLIVGQNGSGKSSILEAISILCTGRSFRSNQIASIIQYGCESMRVVAWVTNQSGNKITVGMDRGHAHHHLHIDRIPAGRLSQFAEQLPLQSITPGSISLVIGSPSVRRSFLDWGLFHVEPSYSQLTRTYRSILKQRNALIRANRDVDQELKYWDDQIVDAGEQITHRRIEYMQSLIDIFNTEIATQIREIIPLNITISYQKGWKLGMNLSEAIRDTSDRERRVGHTVVGPHEADFKIQASGKSAKDSLSRGESKLLSVAFYLAQLKHLQNELNKETVLLIDDLFSELDETHSGSIQRYLLDNQSQIFITSVTTNHPFFEQCPHRMFHVEQGTIVSVVDR